MRNPKTICCSLRIANVIIQSDVEGLRMDGGRPSMNGGWEFLV